MIEFGEVGRSLDDELFDVLSMIESGEASRSLDDELFDAKPFQVGGSRSNG
jgi:hypothetical protein